MPTPEGGTKPRPIRIEEWIDQDLTRAAREGRLAPAFDREDSLRTVEDLLTADPPRSPVLVGGPGIGKTAVMHELVRRSVEGRGPALLREHSVVQLSLRNIASHFANRNKAAAFARKLFDRLRAEPVLVFVRDLHLAYELDWEPILYRYLCRAGRPLLGEGATRPIESLLEYSSDLAEHLVPVPLDEPKLGEVRGLVRSWSAWQEQRSGRAITPDAQRIGIELTARFLGDRPFPRKVLDLLSQTRDATSREEGEDTAVTLLDVVERFSIASRVPAPLVNPHIHLDLDELRRFLSERLLGQDEAAEAVVRMVALIKSGLSDVGRPFGVFLFVGPTGVGKTHTAQLLAEYLFGDRQRLIRVNLTDFAGEEGVLTLFGNPMAQRMEQRAGVLSARLRGHPFGVLLLDEFEKAHPKVYDAFMQLFDEGRFMNGNGDVVSVTSLIVIATSNAGAEVYRETGVGFRETLDVASLDAELDRRLHRVFRFELLNRFDRVVHFHPLQRSHIRDIAARELQRLLDRDGVVGRGLRVEIEPEVVEWLAAWGYHPHYGARFLRREIERHVAAALADLIVRAHPHPGARLALGVRAGRIAARLEEDAVPTAAVTLPDEAVPVRLDRAALVEEARAWVERWAPLLLESGARRDAASLLIDQSTAPGFWADAEHAREVLRRYKALEARIQADERLCEPARRLERLLAATRPAPIDELARAVEAAAGNYRKWLDLGLADAPDAAWIVIGPGDPLGPSPALVADLVGMYRAWLERQGFAAEVVAEEEQNGEILRAVVEAEGPGVWAVLEMEHGRHRRRRADGEIERASVEVLPRRATTADGARVQAARHTRGKLVERRVARLRLDLPRRGLQVQLLGPDAESLGLLGADLAAAWASAAPELEVARTYALVGGTARDPRTGASAANVKDVLRGHLEPFLAAWEARGA